jgi:hypothetical protein
MAIVPSGVTSYTISISPLHRPIQLLRPPGLCNPVCPIFTIVIPEAVPKFKWELASRVTPGNMLGEDALSVASAVEPSVLFHDSDGESNACEGDADGLYGTSEPRRLGASGTGSARGTGRNASADHSYHT